MVEIGAAKCIDADKSPGVTFQLAGLEPVCVGIRYASNGGEYDLAVGAHGRFGSFPRIVHGRAQIGTGFHMGHMAVRDDVHATPLQLASQRRRCAALPCGEHPVFANQQRHVAAGRTPHGGEFQRHGSGTDDHSA